MAEKVRVCWLLSDDEILSQYKKYGEDAFPYECDTCHTMSCSINTGFVEGRRLVSIDLEKERVISCDE